MPYNQAPISPVEDDAALFEPEEAPLPDEMLEFKESRVSK